MRDEEYCVRCEGGAIVIVMAVVGGQAARVTYQPVPNPEKSKSKHHFIYLIHITPNNIHDNKISKNKLCIPLFVDFIIIPNRHTCSHEIAK